MTVIKQTKNPQMKTSVEWQYGFVAAAGRKSDMLNGSATLARFEAHLGVLEGTSQETIATLLGIGQTAHLSGTQVDRLIERANEYMAAAVRAQRAINTELRKILVQFNGKLRATGGRFMSFLPFWHELTAMAERGVEDAASVMACVLLRRLTQIPGDVFGGTGVAADRCSEARGVKSVMEAAAAGEEASALEGRVPSTSEADSMAYALHAHAMVEADALQQNALARIALTTREAFRVGKFGRLANLLRALPTGRVLRAACQGGLGVMLAALQGEDVNMLHQQKIVKMLQWQRREQLQLRRAQLGEAEELEEEEEEEEEEVAETVMEADETATATGTMTTAAAAAPEAAAAAATSVETAAAEAVETVAAATACLTVAGLQEALEAVAAVEALLPAGTTGFTPLRRELGILARWLIDVLALGEFLRAAREAHEVSSSQCQLTEASKAKATALREALWGQMTKARGLLRTPGAGFLLRARRVTAFRAQAHAHANPQSGVGCARQQRCLERSPLDGLTFTRGRPSDVDTWEPLGEHSAALYSHIIASDELPPAFEAVVGSWVYLEEGALIVEPCEQSFGAAIRRHAAHIGDLDPGLVDHLVCLTVSACLFVCGSFIMPSRPSLPPVRITRVEVYGGGDEDGSSGIQHLEEVQGERYLSIRRGGMYWQRYAQGFGWGMTVRSARTSHILVRATMPPTGELGLTRWARASALLVGLADSLCPGAHFHELSTVIDITVDDRLRLVL